MLILRKSSAPAWFPHGWIVEIANNGGDALQLLNNFKYDFILLDWNLPDISGVQICRQFREQGGTTPIILLTGRHSIEDKESGLDSGGDDYLTKPFDVRELLARMRTIQRRPARFVLSELSINGVVLNLKLRCVSCGEKTTKLSAIECNLMEFLFRNSNEYFSSAKLFTSVWPSDTDSSDETVKVHMSVLRRKLALIGAEELIKTERKLGYIIEDMAVNKPDQPN